MDNEILDFKNDIKNYVQELFTLILEDYRNYLPISKIEFIENYDFNNNIIIDKGGKYTKAPARIENNVLSLSPTIFYDNFVKNYIDNDLKMVDIDLVEEKFKNLPYELFSVNDLKTLIKTKNLSCFDVCRGLVIHELFHYLITVKSSLEEYKIIYNGKEYKCKGVIGEYLEEGLVELYARMFALKHNLFMFPNINYQDNIKFVLKLRQEIGSNMDKLVFNSDYLGLLNYVHKNGLKEEYSSLENAWLEKRMVSRFDKMNEIKEEEIEELMMEEI